MPRRTLDVMVPGMTASTSGSNRQDAGKAAVAQGLGGTFGVSSTSAPAGACPGTPRKDANEPLDETFIDVRIWVALKSCPVGTLVSLYGHTLLVA